MVLILHSKRQWNVHRTLNIAFLVPALSHTHPYHLIIKDLLSFIALIPMQPPGSFLTHSLHVFFHKIQGIVYIGHKEVNIERL